ncbi:MAG: PAS domain-containing sensor histidine kinase, partial [Nitrososphaera sp.]
MKTENKPSTQRRRKVRFPSSRREEIIEKQYAEIKQLESRYRKLYEGSPVMLRTINTDGIILDCNQAYVSGLGFSSKSDVIGHSIFEHTPGDAILAKRESFEEWRRSGLVKNNEVWLKRTDGSKFLALINANNLYDDEGHLVGSNTVITDLTEILKTKRQQEKAAEEIRKAYGMKEEFIRIAAHELRTPIQPILLIAELAKSDSTRQNEAWEIVLKETKKLKHLADDILDVSRIESGDLSYNMQKVRLSDIISV